MQKKWRQFYLPCELETANVPAGKGVPSTAASAALDGLLFSRGSVAAFEMWVSVELIKRAR